MSIWVLKDVYAIVVHGLLARQCRSVGQVAADEVARVRGLEDFRGSLLGEAVAARMQIDGREAQPLAPVVDVHRDAALLDPHKFDPAILHGVASNGHRATLQAALRLHICTMKSLFTVLHFESRKLRASWTKSNAGAPGAT